jgi:hypothetical protein
VGLTGDTLTAVEMFHNMGLWSDAGLVASALCLVTTAVVCLRVWVQPHSWVQGTTVSLSMCTLLYFCGVLLPPFTFLFSTGFKVTLSGNSSMVQSDPSILKSVDHGIGTGFSSVAFTWFAVIFAFMVQGLPVGLFCATSLFRCVAGWLVLQCCWHPSWHPRWHPSRNFATTEFSFCSG